MPFKVTADGGVRLGDITDRARDFLVVTLDGTGQRIYLRRTWGTDDLTFDAALLSPSFRDASMEAARQWLRAMPPTYCPELEKLFDAREDRGQSLLKYVAAELRRDVPVVHMHELRIGADIVVSFLTAVGKLSAALPPHAWRAGTPVADIRPSDRMTILIKQATGG